MDAGLLDKPKPRLPLLRKMHHLCSLARVTYTEFGLIFDSKITARYPAAHAAALEAPGIHPFFLHTFMHSLFYLYPHHGLKDNTPPSPFSVRDAVPSFPQVHPPLHDGSGNT